MAPPKTRRPGFSKRAQYTIFAGYMLAILGAVVGALLLAISIIDPRGFAALRTAGAEVTRPIAATLAELGDGLGAAGTEVRAYIDAGSKIAAMERELEETRIEILEARALQQENERLKRLLKLDEEEPDAVGLARLISSSASSARRLATLDLGSRDGVEPGQPVRAPEGLVGRVLEVGPNTARVLLVSDMENVTPVKRASDGIPAFATGRGDGTVEIRAINVGSNPFKGGDLFVTSGSGGLYSPNIPVAIVLRPTDLGAVGRVLATGAKASHVIVQPIFQAETVAAIEAGELDDGSAELENQEPAADEGAEP